MIKYADLYAEYKECQRDVDAAMRRCIDNSSFINGPEVLRFEQSWASYVGSEAAAGVSSGTSALMLALSTLGVGPGAEVIVPSMSFISTAEAVSQLGATPVFIDIDQYHLLDIEQVAAAITPATRAVIFVDLYGQTLDIKSLYQAVNGLPLIRDAAQSAGCQYIPGHAEKYVHATCWSFYPGKNLSAIGDAGAVTGSEEVCDLVRFLRDHGRTEKYVHLAMGWNERLDGLQAAVLDAKLPWLNIWNSRRQYNASIYREMFFESSIVLPAEHPQSTHVYNQFVIEVDRRLELKEFLLQENIESGIQFPLGMHQQPVYRSLDYSLPKTEKLAATCLSLPVHAQMTEEQVRRVACTVLDFVS
jgi:dTDP-4-amino-4,6-dideoxygalactose transaminase